MESAGERRAFLVGMTLNELVFLLFFLLLIVSAVALKSAGDQAKQRKTESQQLFEQLDQSREQLDQAFKKMVLQEAVLSRLDQASRDQQDLDEFFRRLVEDRRKAAELDRSEADNRQLTERIRQLEAAADTVEQIEQLLSDAGIDGDPAEVVRALIDTALHNQRRANDLEGQLAYLGKQLKAWQGSGVDHPPCWANPQTGGIEYLYRITILDTGLHIAPAWPERRADEARQLPGALELINRTVSSDQFRRLARPIYDWSLAHECRHFVRVVDDPGTSKQTFKDRLRTIESYFYKLLERQ